MQQQATASVDQERSRLIDHFKRAYQIVVGLAITLACTKLFPDGTIRSDTSFWLFCIFFITVVPIFHGGDRSLDVKYLRAQPVGFWERAAYVWDVYVLLITAILFVKIAQSIPGSPAPAGGSILGAAPPQTTPELFYWWMGVMLLFDAAMLFVDRVKSAFLGTEGEDGLRAYWKWIALNLALAVVCLGAAAPPDWLASLPATAVAIVVFGFASLRTLLDYVSGSRFLFP
jgi:hypothetical protein